MNNYLILIRLNVLTGEIAQGEKDKKVLFYVPFSQFVH
jgi:hypothetical protein